MKKLLLILFVVAITPVAVGQFSIGPRIGFTAGSLSTDLDTISANIDNSFDFGVFVRLGQKIYLQPEVVWVTKASEIKYDFGGTQDVKVDAIEIPVLVGWRIMNLGLGNVRIMAGPSAGIVVGKNIEAKNITDPIKEADIEDLIWSVNVGAGVDLLMFTLDIRYQAGLSEVIKQVNNQDFNLVGNSFKISLGWKIL